MKFETYTDIILAIEIKAQADAERHGFRTFDLGGSQQSCSSYFTLYNSEDGRELRVRTSNHTARHNAQQIDLNVALFSDHGEIQIEATEVYMKPVVIFDADGSCISDDLVQCDADECDAELTHFEVAPEETNRVASMIVAAALAAAPEDEFENA